MLTYFPATPRRGAYQSDIQIAVNHGEIPHHGNLAVDVWVPRLTRAWSFRDEGRFANPKSVTSRAGGFFENCEDARAFGRGDWEGTSGPERWKPLPRLTPRQDDGEERRPEMLLMRRVYGSCRAGPWPGEDRASFIGPAFQPR